MRISNLLLAFALPLVLFSCAKEPVPAPAPDSGKPSVERRKLTLTATLPGETKSMLQDGSKVLWTPGDPGAGYGMSSVFWEDSDGGWARVTDLSRSGLLLDAGFCLDAGAFTFCAGACSLGLREWSCLLGAGIRF